MPPAKSVWDGKPEPDIKLIEKIARRCLHIEGKDPCDVKFPPWVPTPGVAIKVYTIKANGREFTIDVWPGALPEAIQSRAATTHWLQDNTTVPVMPYFCSEDAEDIELGLGWELQPSMASSHMAGNETLRLLGPHVWVQMSWGSKKKFVETLATYHTQLLDPSNRFKTVGSIFFGVDPELETESSTADVASKKADKRFYVRDLDDDLSRPPTSKFTDLIYSELDGAIDGLSRCVSEGCDCECEDCQTVKSEIAVGKRLREKIAQILPPEIDSITETVIELPPLQEKMLVVDRKGEIGEIKQASHASTVPIWRAYQLPYVLLGSERLEVPAENAPNYRAKYIEWYKTKLRDVYLERMEMLHPGFQKKLKEYQPLNDISWLTLKCGFSPAMAGDVEDWLDGMEKGNHCSLRNKLFEHEDLSLWS
ncbi:hypothetical protein H2200_012528 [Cladophialophora chaetospira]|uniref:Aminoglycoside phosphotransferase domain-containing protein n=1 Tax=Cladophialophora chaetospira TaxID=386627 RepID=A0AA39CC10_9EURO|nr:hypothetical protein H2200_012528 [Cladophialophora chaetospira]